MKRMVFLLVIISLAPSCFSIPLPSEHRQEINKLRSQVAVGSTTREEVISILGQPDVTRDRSIFYRHKEYKGGKIVHREGFRGICLGLYGIGPNCMKLVGRVYMDLYFEFDKHGVLTDYRVDKYN